MSTSKRVNKSLKDKYETVMDLIAKRKSRKAICLELGVLLCINLGRIIEYVRIRINENFYISMFLYIELKPMSPLNVDI